MKMPTFLFAAAASTCMAPASAQSPAAYTEIGASIRHERPDNGTPLWRESAVELAHQFAPRTAAIARAARVERFGLEDSTLSLAGYLPLGAQMTGYLEAGASDRHQFIWKHYVHGQLTRTLGGGWGIIGGLKHLEYDAAKIDAVDLGVERYFGSWRAALAVIPSRSSTAGNGETWKAQLGYYYGERSSVNLVFSDGTEVDRPVGPGRIIATPVTAFEVYGRHWLGSSWALEYAAGRVEQGTVTRRTLAAGLRYRF